MQVVIAVRRSCRSAGVRCPRWALVVSPSMTCTPVCGQARPAPARRTRWVKLSVVDQLGCSPPNCVNVVQVMDDYAEFVKHLLSLPVHVLLVFSPWFPSKRARSPLRSRPRA